MKPRQLFPLLLLLLMTGCRSGRTLTEQTRCLSAKMQLTMPVQGKRVSIGGTVKLIHAERIRFSFVMPLVRSEVARLDLTPDSLFFIDRRNRTYLQAACSEASELLPTGFNFAQLEQLIRTAASRSPRKATLRGEQLCIAALAKSRIKLSGFSGDEFSLPPAQLSARYTRINWTVFRSQWMQP
ncbi:MAG: DUF4292 domain-containing protein [Prevotellaceae bacterium]|jgi:hypothetical protein|nr:DUF4292 domain-containing protein [Prevotellaceae bacterium]